MIFSCHYHILKNITCKLCDKQALLFPPDSAGGEAPHTGWGIYFLHYRELTYTFGCKMSNFGCKMSNFGCNTKFVKIQTSSLQCNTNFIKIWTSPYRELTYTFVCKIFNFGCNTKFVKIWTYSLPGANIHFWVQKVKFWVQNVQFWVLH